MYKKLSSYWVYFLIIVVVGCSELPVQYTSSQSEINSGAFAKRKYGSEEREADVMLRAKEVVKKRNRSSGKEVYLIDSSDILDITVFEEPDLSVKLKVARDGTISYPLINAVSVINLTTQEVEKKLEELLLEGGYLKDPRIAVRLDIELMETFNEKEIFIMGEVKNPGPITILGKNITALEAVVKAGGFTEYAAPNRTTVIRVENDKEKTIQVDLNKVKDGYRSGDVKLRAGDVVVVPETFF